jgi:hypothetical protein
MVAEAVTAALVKAVPRIIVAALSGNVSYAARGGFP